MTTSTLPPGRDLGEAGVALLREAEACQQAPCYLQRGPFLPGPIQGWLSWAGDPHLHPGSSPMESDTSFHHHY